MSADLDLLDPPPLAVTAGGESFALAPLPLRKLPAVLRALAGVRLPGSAGEIDLVALMSAHGEQVLLAAAIAADIPPLRLARFTPEEAAELLAKLVEINDGLVLPPAEAGAARPLGWVDAIQILVSAGHRYADVLDYTVPQCRAFLRAIERQRRGDARMALTIARGAQATKEAYSNLWATLIGDDDEAVDG